VTDQRKTLEELTALAGAVLAWGVFVALLILMLPKLLAGVALVTLVVVFVAGRRASRRRDRSSGPGSSSPSGRSDQNEATAGEDP